MKDDGGSVFPEASAHGGSGEYWTEHLPGMSLRDYFAAKAMQGLIAYEGDSERFQGIAREAYAQADAMLEERNK